MTDPLTVGELKRRLEDADDDATVQIAMGAVFGDAGGVSVDEGRVMITAWSGLEEATR